MNRESLHRISEEHATPNSCLFCNSNKIYHWLDHYCQKNGEKYPIFRCSHCASGFVFPIPSFEYLTAFYSTSELNSYQEKLESQSPKKNLKWAIEKEIEFPNSTIDAKKVCETLVSLETGKRLLDIGAGTGFFSKAAIDAGFIVTAVELNTKSREVFALMNGFEADGSPFDEAFASKNAGKFDVIIMSQVLEHISMTTRPISSLKKLLAPHGVCAILVPRFKSSISIIQGKKDMFIIPPEHLNFFTVNGLNTLFEQNNFTVLKTETVSRFDKKNYFSKFKPKLLNYVLVKSLSLFLGVSDKMNRGMFVHSYFRKNK